MQNFRNLKVWEKAHSLTLDVYLSSREFPREEMYGFDKSAKARRCFDRSKYAEAVAEGRPELGRFLQIAMDPRVKLSTTAWLARDLKFLQLAAYERLNCE